MQRPISDQEYRDFRIFLENATGILLGDAKHYLVSSRLHRILEERQLSNIADLLALIKQDRGGELRNRVIEAMTTNETLWFRDGYPYDTLRNLILPELAKGGPRRINMWSAACSSGQEPYSISMTVEEFLASRPGSLPGGVTILATDISTRVLQEARQGVYDATSLARGLSDERRSRFMIPVDPRAALPSYNRRFPDNPLWEVRGEIKNRVNFRELNLTQNLGSVGRFDVVFCRNVLIYFSMDLKRSLLAKLAGVLNPGGWLFLGSSESLAGMSDSFEMVRADRGVVYRVRS